MSTNRSILLGLFFLATLGVLIYYTLFLTDFTLLKKPSELRVRFADTNGLREGDSVLVAGMRWGRVKDLDYDPAAQNHRRITVVATLKKPLVLREGFSIRIEDATLLGGKNLTVDPGPATGAVVHPDQELFGSVARNPLESLGNLVTESQKGVTKIVEDLSEVTRGIREGKGPMNRIVFDEAMARNLADSIQSASRTLANLERISTDMTAGRGTAGKLFADPELYDELASTARKLNRTLDQVGAMVTDFREGKGILSRLFTDEKVAQDVTAAVASINSIVAKIDRGEGTAGVLVNDDTIAKNLAGITGRIERGEGSLGALLTRSDVYENLRETSENLAVVTAAVKNGQGSLGRLVMDDEVYQQIKTALLIVQRALEEYREAAPITTFTSVFFGAF